MRRTAIIAEAGLLTAVAVLLGYVESLFPLPVPIPGVKLGLANTAVLVALVRRGWKLGLTVSVVRVCLNALLFSGFSGFLYSISGAVGSFLVMTCTLRFPALGLAGVSLVGGMTHTLAQLSVAVWVTRTSGLWAYGPVLAFSGAATGFLTGLVAAGVLRLLPGTFGQPGGTPGGAPKGS